MEKIKNDKSLKEGLLFSFLCMNAQGNELGNQLMDKLLDENVGIKYIINQSKLNGFECQMNPTEIRKFRDEFKLNPHEALYGLIKLNIEADQEQLPMEIDEGMVMTAYKLEGDNIVITMVLDENLYEIDAFEENEEIIKESMMEEGVNDPDSKALLDLCKVSHTGLIYRMVGSITKRHVDVKLSSDYICKNVITPSSVNIH